MEWQKFFGIGHHRGWESRIWSFLLALWYTFNESDCLGMQSKMGGKFHLKLNIGERPIANKYREGKMKRTLKRELNSTWNCQKGSVWHQCCFSENQLRMFCFWGVMTSSACSFLYETFLMHFSVNKSTSISFVVKGYEEGGFLFGESVYSLVPLQSERLRSAA